MPLYDYECDLRHRTERFFSVSEKPFAIRCPRCKREALQIIATAPAFHSLSTFSRDIDDEQVRATRNPGDGSYLDPTLSFDWENNSGIVTPITSEKQRQTLMKEKGLFEKPASEKAKDVARLKKKRPIHFMPAAKAAQGGQTNAR